MHFLTSFALTKWGSIKSICNAFPIILHVSNFSALWSVLHASVAVLIMSLPAPKSLKTPHFTQDKVQIPQSAQIVPLSGFTLVSGLMAGSPLFSPVVGEGLPRKLSC